MVKLELTKDQLIELTSILEIRQDQLNEKLIKQPSKFWKNRLYKLNGILFKARNLQ